MRAFNGRSLKLLTAAIALAFALPLAAQAQTTAPDTTAPAATAPAKPMTHKHHKSTHHIVHKTTKKAKTAVKSAS